MTWKGYLVIVLVSALAVFVVQNYEVVEVKFLIWSFKASRAVVIFFTLSIGVVVGWLISHRKAKPLK